MTRNALFAVYVNFSTERATYSTWRRQSNSLRSVKTNGGGKYLSDTSCQSPQSLHSLRAKSSSIRRLILRNHRTAALTNSVGGRIGDRSGRTCKMTSGWRSLGNVRSFVNNSMGGLRGRTNIASWIVAGTLAYFLWVKPAQDLKREHKERAALAAADPYLYVEKRKPLPGPQETGLTYGQRSKIDHGQKRVEKPEE